MVKEKERLFFIVKSWLMGQIVSIIFLGSVLALGVINFIQSVIIGSIGYVFSLVILRFCDNQVNSVVRKILKFLDKHRKIKEFILKYF